MKTISKLWLLIAILAVLTPLGIILPELFKAGGAWGEWSAEEMRGLVGYIPKGLERLSSLWNAPIPDYASNSKISYIVSAVLGVTLVAILLFLVGKFLGKKE